MQSPFDILKEYESRGNNRILSPVERAEPQGVWRGIGYRVGQKYLVSPYKEVVEITRLPDITPVLGAQPWMAGLCNLNGELYPVVSLPTFLGESPVPLHPGQRVLVMDRGDGERDIILVVDEILGHRSFTDAQISTPSALFEGRMAPFVLHTFSRDGMEWGVFSLSQLSTHPSFQSASAL